MIIVFMVNTNEARTDYKWLDRVIKNQKFFLKIRKTENQCQNEIGMTDNQKRVLQALNLVLFFKCGQSPEVKMSL